MKNPFIDKLNENITLSVCKDTMSYFREQSEKTGIPLDSLINAYLAEAMMQNRQFPSIK